MIQDNLLQKWLNGTLADEEMKTFQQSDAYATYKRIAEDASHFKASHFNPVPDYESFRAKYPRTQPKEPKIRRVTWILRIASIFILGLVTYYFLIFNAATIVETQLGQKAYIELPDASLVHLNASSEIRYSKKNWNKKRTLDLKGEAFFDVAKGTFFDVHTSLGTVTVVGTEFNVKQRGATFEVACYEGIVRVISGNYTRELKIGDRLRLAGDSLTLGKIIKELPQWTNNISFFEQIPFIEVVEELQRQYDVKITLNKVSTKAIFTGGFVHDNLENAIQAIAEPMGLRYEISPNGQVILTKREN